MKLISLEQVHQMYECDFSSM